MIIAMAFSLLFGSAPWQAPIRVQDKAPVIEHQFDNPESDAASAVAAGDSSLRGVNGFTVMIPGISGGSVALAAKFKIRVIENTSDTGPRSYNEAAAKYAFAYNRFVFQRLGCSHETPLDTCSHYP